MSDQLQEKVLAYLETHNVITLATGGPEGLWAAAVFYVNEGWSLFFLSAPHTRHSKNIAATGLVAGTIQEDYHRWEAIKGIQLEGRCHLLAGEAREAAIARYAAKFPIIGPDAPPQIAQAMSKIGWYEIVPEKLYFIDNSLGLGHRDEIIVTVNG